MDDLIMLLIVLGAIVLVGGVAVAISLWVGRHRYETLDEARRRRERRDGSAPPDPMPTSFD
ncbi:hypothetical protein RDV89_08485 [Nocardioides zeae]|uniref:Cbb3-type cytochrome oxidase assembly protein CcoS n=1 Tax=Nocardioides imazamoxiresistens TaxID=3231893 RepID=A0ABU3PV41_9ACTN|nr:hypothetical protein [Nocardioides zeae]MDT9593102.1 hypothetical protein [Nocardioides zeae]